MSKKTIVCRVCLEPQQNAYVSLSEKYRDFVLYEFINTISSLNIRLSDGFPDKICAACHSQLTVSIDFKEKCEASDVLLRSNAVKQELLAEYKDISVKSEDIGDTIKFEYDNINCDDAVDCTRDLEPEQDVKEENDGEEQVVHALQPTTDRPSRAIDLKLICHDCGGSFKSKCKLKVHWKKTHMYDSLVCPLCKRNFKTYKALHQHKKKKTKSCAIAADVNVTVEGVGKGRIFSCKQCNYKTKLIEILKAHIVIHTGDRPYKCDLCPKSYKQLGSLHGHKEFAHEMYGVETTCHICGKSMKGRWKKDQHMRQHTKVECPVCHKNISQANMSQHKKRHSGTKSYACDKCTCTFYTAAELCTHKRLKHSGEKLKCEFCDFTCVKKMSMQTHRNKHKFDGIPCTICGLFFLTKEKLVKHQRVHFAEKSHRCPHCEASFYKRDSVRRHLRAVHCDIAPKLKPVPVVVTTETKSAKKSNT